MLSKLVVAQRFGEREKQRSIGRSFIHAKKKAVERDLRRFLCASQSKLCESTFMQKSVAASALAIRNHRRNEEEHYERYLTAQLAFPVDAVMQAAPMSVLARAMEAKVEYRQNFQRISLPRHFAQRSWGRTSGQPRRRQWPWPRHCAATTVIRSADGGAVDTAADGRPRPPVVAAATLINTAAAAAATPLPLPLRPAAATAAAAAP